VSRLLESNEIDSKEFRIFGTRTLVFICRNDFEEPYSRLGSYPSSRVFDSLIDSS
jgi:hypothetical protein